MTATYTKDDVGSVDTIASEHIAVLLDQVLERMDRIEGKLNKVEALSNELPAAIATATDLFDGLYSRAAAAGINGDERVRLGLVALERLSAPENVRAITNLSAQLSTLDQVVREAPGFAAMAVDIVDSLYATMDREGVNLEQTTRQALLALRNFITLLETDEVRTLMDSGILDVKTLQVIGAAANALVCTQREPRRAGPLTLLRALFDRNIQRTLGFALGFAERFGQNLPTFPQAK